MLRLPALATGQPSVLHRQAELNCLISNPSVNATDFFHGFDQIVDGGITLRSVFFELEIRCFHDWKPLHAVQIYPFFENTIFGLRHGRRKGGGRTPLDFENFSKKGVFLVSNGKSKISPLLAPLEKFWKNPLVPPLWKKSFRCPCSPLQTRLLPSKHFGCKICTNNINSRFYILNDSRTTKFACISCPLKPGRLHLTCWFQSTRLPLLRLRPSPSCPWASRGSSRLGLRQQNPYDLRSCAVLKTISMYGRTPSQGLQTNNWNDWNLTCSAALSTKYSWDRLIHREWPFLARLWTGVL